MSAELRVIETATGEVVNTLDVSRRSEREIDKIEMGLMHRINLDHFHVERHNSEGTEP